MNINFVCIKDGILQDVPHQLWEATTADGHSANVLVTRFLHNKLLFYSNNFFRCYLSYLSPDFVTTAFSIIGLVFFLAGVYFLVRRRIWILLVILLLAPLSPLFSFPKNNLVQGLILYSVLLLVILFGLYHSLRSK